MFLYISKILKIIGPSRKYLFMVIIYFITLSFLELFSISLVPVYVGVLLGSDNIYFTNFITYFNSLISLPNPKITLGVFLTFIFIIKFVFAIYINKKILIFSLTQLKTLRSNILSKYQQLDFLNFLNSDKSKFIYNTTSLTVEFTFTLLIILRLLGDLLIGFCIIIFLANLNFTILFIFLFFFLVLLFLFDFKFKSKLNAHGKLLNQSGSDVIKYTEECINGFKEIKILNKEQFFYNKVKVSTENYANSLLEIQTIQMFPKYLIELFLILLVVSFSFFWLLSGNQLNDFIISMSAFGVASVKLFPMFSSFLQTLTYLRSKKNSVDRLFNNLHDVKICKKISTSQIDIKFFENFTIKNFSFIYPKQEKFIFKNSFFDLKKKDSVGILGNSGEGKSTLVNIFSGLLQISSGQLIINNKNLDTKNINPLKNFIAYLPQDIFFINGTIKDNIALGVDPNFIKDHDIFNALKLSGAYDFVMDLPSNINSPMGEGGANFSGGEKQRIGIARAMYFNKEILIFDEITSNLDSENTRNIKKEMLKLKKIKTMIIITHDPQLIDFCDKVYKVENQTLTLIT